MGWRLAEPTQKPRRGRASPQRSSRRPYGSGGSELDQKLRAVVEELGVDDSDLTFEMLATAVRLAREPVTRLDRKIANAALKEMRYAFNVFGRYRDVRKVSVFGSARVHRSDPEYQTARELGRLMASRGWMVVTGAGPGIMQAGHEGAGKDLSIGVNIVLPLESKPNEFIADNAKLINFKYFFTRKLMFMKEADAFVLCPGGFGTMDEAFELLTLLQTGKSDLHPIVLLEAPGGTYWDAFESYLRDHLLRRGYIGEEDLGLYYRCQEPAAALAEIERFYRVYHSQRYVGKQLILRLQTMPSDSSLSALSSEFSDMLVGPIRITKASTNEVRDGDAPELPRIAVPFDRQHFGRLRRLIDRLNEEGVAASS
jgi:uncharacterized protein (TIGR00730 family)